MPTWDAPVSLGTLSLTKDESRKKVKGTEELTKMADTNTPEEGLGMSSHKFQAEHGLK